MNWVLRPMPTPQVKRQATTNPALGCIPIKRSIPDLLRWGIVVVDKPPGPTSHQISDMVQKILHIPKSGHSGSLDPNVTGVLPVALERATRVVSALLPSTKEYIALMHFHKLVEQPVVEQLFCTYTGTITQMPPIKSSVKRQERERTIYSLTLIEQDGQDVLFSVSCQAGTYIRKLIHDLGQSAGVGAHMAELRRLKAGPFREHEAHTLHDLLDAYMLYKDEGIEGPLRYMILPFEEAVRDLPYITVTDGSVESLCQGSFLYAPGVCSYTQFEAKKPIAVFTLKHELIGLGMSHISSAELISLEKGIVAKLHTVFMDRGIYKV